MYAARLGIQPALRYDLSDSLNRFAPWVVVQFGVGVWLSSGIITREGVLGRKSDGDRQDLFEALHDSLYECLRAS